MVAGPGRLSTSLGDGFPLKAWLTSCPEEQRLEGQARVRRRQQDREKEKTHHHHHHTLPPVLVWPHWSTQHTTSKVDLHVLGNVTPCLDTLATHITLEIPHSSVSEGVSIAIISGKKSFTTLITLMISNTTVYQDVSGEAFLFSKFLSTFHTLMISHTTVCQGVSFKPFFGCKSFTTLLTPKPSLCSVAGAACLHVILATWPGPPHT